jgi:HEAT repeat protein
MRARHLAFFLVLLVAGCGGGAGGYREPEPPSVTELTAMLKSEDSDKQITAAAWIKKLGPKAAETAPSLIAVLKSEHVGVRKNAAEALGQIGPATSAAVAVPALAATLDDPEPRVQKAAIDALGQFGPAASSAIPALEKMSTRTDLHSSVPNALKKIRQ